MKKSIGYRIFIWVTTGVLALIILFPVFWIFTSSITEKELLFTTPVTYFPKSPTLQNYQSLFKEVDVTGLALNTMIVAMFSIIGSLFVSLLAAYAFARFKFKGSQVAYSMLVFSAMLPVIMTLIPMFETYKTLNLHDTHLGLVVLYISGFIPFTTMSFVTFIQQIPYSLEEAAAVDGASVSVRIFQVLFPLMKPAIATMAIINFINSMNEFMIPLVFTNIKATPLSVGLTLIPRVNQYNVPWEKISALATLMLIPIIIFVVFFEKNIIDGLTAGSVKQ